MKIGIIGTGAYAIALTSLLENKNNDIIMWTKLESEYEELKNNYTNLKVINYKLNNKINFTNNLEELSNKSEVIIIAIPAKFIKETIKNLKKYYLNQPILIATKGMIVEDNILINDYINRELNTNNISCISGPSFAKDIILKHPIGLTLAFKNQNNCFYKLFSNISYLTLETTNDIIGVELCGILKNIIAIGSGILKGMNTNPSTITKFLIDTSKDIQKIIKNGNGNINTFYTYAGLGDYLLTTTNIDSRNYSFGLLIGKDDDYKNYQKTTTIEGLENLKGMYNYLKANNIDSEIINILYKIICLNESKDLLIKYLENKE